MRIFMTLLFAIVVAGAFSFYFSIASKGNNYQADRMIDSFNSSKPDSDEVQHILANAAASERSVLFLNVDWAMMEAQKRRFAEYILTHQNNSPNDSINFHYVDCSLISDNYAPLKSLKGWAELEKTRDTSLIQGWGELVWMQKGRVLHVEPILNTETVADLTEKTKSIFQSNE